MGQWCYLYGLFLMWQGSKHSFCGPPSVLKESMELLFSYPVHYTHIYIAVLRRFCSLRSASLFRSGGLYQQWQKSRQKCWRTWMQILRLVYLTSQSEQYCHLMMASTCFLVELGVQPKVGTLFTIYKTTWVSSYAQRTSPVCDRWWLLSDECSVSDSRFWLLQATCHFEEKLTL